MSKKQRWKMPKWMEPYRQIISNTGGNSIEELMERWLNDRHLAATNEIVFALCVAVSSQVTLLNHLHHDGLLAERKKSS